MTESIRETFGLAIALHAEPFRYVAEHPLGLYLGLTVALLAGLSRGLGDVIILFLNQVNPLRLVLTLLLDAGLFALGFLALVGSTWCITALRWSEPVDFVQLVAVLGLAHVPFLLAILGALPHFGTPILAILSVLNLIGMAVGFGALADIGPGEAFGYVAFGWLLLELAQNTLGLPVAKLCRWLGNTVAGVELIRDPRELLRLANQPVVTPFTGLDWREEWSRRLTGLRKSGQETGTPAPSRTAPIPPAVSRAASPLSPPAPRRDLSRSLQRGLGKGFKLLLGGFGILLVGVITLILLDPLRLWWFGWVTSLPATAQFFVNFFWIGIAGLIFAGLLAPIETLGWYAGWYDRRGDEDHPRTDAPGELAKPVADPSAVKRFIVYMDGVAQSNRHYLPDTEKFLERLTGDLPEDMALVRGIMPYSVMNRPLDENRPLAFFWKRVHQLRFIANPASILGMMVNLRNIFVVLVSADRRYGPLYNRGVAQVVHDGLVKNGYRPGSGVPVTFIGFSGGGQISCACAPLLNRSLRTPVDVISIGGVISGNNNLMKVEQLYHLVGDKDRVARLGPLLFPGRWKLFSLSFWNRALRRGNISVFPMGPVGHQLPGGILDPDLVLPDGRSALDQTIDTVLAIVRGEMPEDSITAEPRPSNYTSNRANPLVRIENYPLHMHPDPARYVPVAEWLGRLILPPRSARFRGAFLEIHHAPAEHADLIGRTVRLGWTTDPDLLRLRQAVTHDLHFSAEAEYSHRHCGVIHPLRLNHWLQVDPLESLAGARPEDDMIVALEEPEVARTDSHVALRIAVAPMEVTGRYLALVRFLGPAEEGENAFRVTHYDRQTRDFTGPEEAVLMPPVTPALTCGSHPSTARGIERSPCNPDGWYIHGALDSSGRFVVQALAPRALFRIVPERVVFGGPRKSYSYLRKEAWKDAAARKGTISSVLCTPRKRDRKAPEASVAAATGEWKPGERALVIHTYGGIGGRLQEPAASGPVYFGHFSYGRADVILDPLSGEPRFDIRYHQVYTHNPDGLVAGTLHWSRYQGDRQFGWLGNRPSCDILVKLDSFTESYELAGISRSPFLRMESHLRAMMARYRIGDGTGGTFVGPANNCAQDSNQALFASIRDVRRFAKDHAGVIEARSADDPEKARLRDLLSLGHELERTLQPLGRPRADWDNNEFTLGSTLEDTPLRNLLVGLGSWRTLLPRKASEVVARIFLRHGAQIWVLRTNQVGGEDEDIEPLAPMTF